MTKTSLFWIGFLLLNLNTLYAQKNNEKYKVYDVVFRLVYQENFKVDPILTKETLNKFDFRDPTSNDIITAASVRSPVKDTLTKDWEMFLNHIDTAAIKTGILNKRFIAEYKPVRRYYKTLHASPIVFSPNHNKAICAVRGYSDGEVTEVVCLLEKINGMWDIIKQYWLTM